MLRNYYKESVWLVWWAWLLFLFGIAIPSAFLVVQSFTVLPTWWHPAPTSALLILIGILGLILLNFSRLSIRVDSENIRIRYGIIRKKFSWKEVASSEVIKADFGLYLGLGIRLGTDNSLAFTTSFGNAVRITRKNGSTFVFSTKNPTEISKIINEHSDSPRRTNTRKAYTDSHYGGYPRPQVLSG